MLVKNDLYDYENRYIYQNSDFFKFSLDSILLAEFVKIDPKDRVIIDMCAGNMAIPLILSTYYNNHITGFEIQKSVFSLGNDSILLNNLDNQLNLINDDIKNVGAYYKKGMIDILICNPPFFKVNDIKVINAKPELSYARHEISIKLEDIFSIANMYLKNKGSLYMIHRADRLDEIINFGYKYQVNVKQIQFISTKNGDSPKMVLVKCIKNSKQGVKVTPVLCIEGVKSYKKIFREEK